MMIGRIKTILELRRDPVLWNLFRLNASDVILPRKARTPLFLSSLKSKTDPTLKLPVPETDTGR